ncbi:MAG: ATP-binding protein, partial [Candidatus Altiarchaeales archaeon]|nr:ATP-binding protein [Candidatus Altiarchaeales archaeon]
LARKFGKEVGGGVLLYGPPGCGKTYVAKAAAGECNASFFNVKITDIISSEPGESEKRLHSIFERASRNSPAILFFDEVDALAGRRESGMGAEKRLVNQFLSEMDGFKSIRGVMIIGSTNAPWDVDPALRRAGRFTDLIYLPAPDFETRAEIFKLHTKNRPVAGDVDFSKLGELTEGYSSADIKAVCDHALEIPWEEAYHGGLEREAIMDDFVRTLKERKSSLPPWYLLAEGQVKKSGERELYKDLLQEIENFRPMFGLEAAVDYTKEVRGERDLVLASQFEEKKNKIKELERQKRKIEDSISLSKSEFEKGRISGKDLKKIMVDYQKQLIDVEIELKHLSG